MTSRQLYHQKTFGHEFTEATIPPQSSLAVGRVLQVPPKSFIAFIILGKGSRYHLRFVYFMNLLSLLLTPRRGMFHFGGNSYITMSETSHSDINSAHGSSQQLWCLLSVMSLA